jgi:hypothetical protein
MGKEFSDSIQNLIDDPLDFNQVADKAFPMLGTPFAPNAARVSFNFPVRVHGYLNVMKQRVTNLCFIASKNNKKNMGLNFLSFLYNSTFND